MISIKKLREQYNLTSEEMAKTLKMSKANYSKKENGTVKFSLDEANKIAKMFHMKIEQIFFDEGVTQNATNKQQVS